MSGWTASRLAELTGATLLRDAEGCASGYTIDSREITPGQLLIGIPGERVDGGSFGPQALAAGAWGVIARDCSTAAELTTEGALLEHPSPVEALARMASQRRHDLGCKVVMITGSTGKTSTKDITAAIISASRKTFASHENRNTEIGMPLEILAAPDGTEVMVLEAAMRGLGQIAELATIAEPDVGVIVNVGPVHLELLGSIEAIAVAKTELIRELPAESVSVVPAFDALIEPHIRSDLKTLSFGPGGDVRLAEENGRNLVVDVSGDRFEIEVDFDQPHNRLNLLAAIAAASAIGVAPPRRLTVGFSALRGERRVLPRGIVVIDDCYNANPMSMRAALDDLAGEAARRDGRSVAVLGDMLELGDEGPELHRQVGLAALELSVDELITVGPLAADIASAFGPTARQVDTGADAALLLADLLQPGDTILVKASRGVGLEVVAADLEVRL